MVDTLTPEHRSWNMSRIRSGNTLPEMRVRSTLHCLGYRFRLHRKDLPGKPDVVLPRWKTAVFVHGCFWHRHTECRFAYMPKSKIDFWRRKFAENVARDRSNCAQLRKMGWRVISIWECQTLDPEKLSKMLDRRVSCSTVGGK